MNPEIPAYYDRLARWTALARPFGYGGGREVLTVHRALADPVASGRATNTRVHDILLQALPPLTSPRVLDAGCGLGGTMIDLAARVGGTFVGLTLSERQAAAGSRAIVRAGLESSICIAVGRYDEPPAGPFDLIVAIESLAHSPDPSTSLRALAGVLAPGGVLAIVDDMPLEDAAGSADLGSFKRGWHCPVLWDEGRYRTYLDALGLSVSASRDLTGDCRPRQHARIGQLMWMNRSVRRLIPHRAWRALMDSHHGGLALERLYRGGLMQYRLILASRA